MLAISVRESLREAVAAFGAGGSTVELASPATPEAVFWAIERVCLQAKDNPDDDAVGPPLIGSVP